MAVNSRSQQFAQQAFARVTNRHLEWPEGNPHAETYRAFARRFPTLVHKCGLIQALGFAEAKGHSDYLRDLAVTLNGTPGSTDGPTDDELVAELMTESREAGTLNYLRTTRVVTEAAIWIKRNAESLLMSSSDDDDSGDMT